MKAAHEHPRQGMRKAISGLEDTILVAVASLLFLLAVVAAGLQSHLHLYNTRVQYGLEHLPVALGAACLFTLLVAGLRRLLLRYNLADKSTVFYLIAISLFFCLFWLPAVLEADFDRDDWMLLAAASIRKVIYLHPGYSWHALDSVDGNFRPLGTILYFGYLFRWFGLWALPYFLSLLVVNLLVTFVAFFLVRELGYSKIAGAAAALLFLSRSITYEVQTWPSALGDALVLLFCGLMALLLLQAVRSNGMKAAGLHLLAWTCFFLATLAKQSAFAVPLIVALLFLLRPGQFPRPPLSRRILTAFIGLAVYSGTAAIAFFHAKSLARVSSPYPIGFSGEALLRLFSYVTWYFGTLELPSKFTNFWIVPSLLGLAIVLGGVALCRRWPRALGERPHDVVFCLLSATASLSLFAVLANRSAPYYGSMAAFWGSIALGIVLTRFSPPSSENRPGRIAGLLFCALLVTGFTDIRLKQTGLFPSGGYTWGTFTGSFDRAMYASLQRLLAVAPEAETLVLEDVPGDPSTFTCMALLAGPRMMTILSYDAGTNTYFANSLHGRRPRDGYDALNDPGAYNWTVPLDAAEVARLTAGRAVLRAKYRNGKIVAAD